MYIAIVCFSYTTAMQGVSSGLCYRSSNVYSKPEGETSFVQTWFFLSACNLHPCFAAVWIAPLFIVLHKTIGQHLSAVLWKAGEESSLSSKGLYHFYHWYLQFWPFASIAAAHNELICVVYAVNGQICLLFHWRWYTFLDHLQRLGGICQCPP